MYSFATATNVRLLGIQDLAGAPHFVLTFGDEQGAQNTIWVDVASYLVRRHEIVGSGHHMTSDFSDFNSSPAINPPNPGSVAAGAPALDSAPAMPMAERQGNALPSTTSPPRPLSEGPSRSLLNEARVLNVGPLGPGDDELSGPDPSGSVDWGRGIWRVGQSDTGGLGFRLEENGANAGAFTLVNPSFLVSLRARNNSGSLPAVVGLSCDGRETKRVTILAGETGTIETSWKQPCSTVTVESSGGTNTLFDNVVIQSP
jgi:hypothetical protein